MWKIRNLVWRERNTEDWGESVFPRKARKQERPWIMIATNSKRRKRWWKHLSDEECDPITLEPINTLSYPPFELLSKNGKIWYYDGQVLAHYLVSTGSFLNPMTRVLLTREDCARLDEYLAEYNLKRARVLRAYMLLTGLNSNSRGLEAASLRREATVMIHSIFDFSRYEYRNKKLRHRGGPQINVKESKKGESIVPPPPPPPPPPHQQLRKGERNKGWEVIDENSEHALNMKRLAYENAFPSLESDATEETKAFPPEPKVVECGELGQGEVATAEVKSEDMKENENQDEKKFTGDEFVIDQESPAVRKKRKPRKSRTSVYRASAQDERVIQLLEDQKARRQGVKRQEVARRAFRRRCLMVAGTGTIVVYAASWNFMYTIVFGGSLWVSLVVELALMISILLFIAHRIDNMPRPHGVRHELAGLPYEERPEKTKRIGFTFLGLGTRGDIEPLLALAGEIKARQDDAVVLMIAPGVFADLAAKYGIPFQSCGIDCLEPTADWACAGNVDSFLCSVTNQYSNYFEQISHGFWEGCKAGTHTTDVLITGTFAKHFALDIADALCVPCWAFHFAPDTPTKDAPPFGDAVWSWPWNAGFINKARYLPRILAGLRAIKHVGLAERQNRFRTESLDLLPLTHERLDQMRDMPVIYGYSPTLVPKPADWPSWHFVTGFSASVKGSQPLSRDEQKALAEATQFVNQDALKPICVTFGSMHAAIADQSNPGVIERAIGAALMLEPPRRCIIVCPNPDHRVRELATKNPESILVVRNIPYTELFPLCSCVVYHGGAGTTARVLQFGLPSVVIPVLKWYDQIGWGSKQEQSGSGHMVRLEESSHEKLREALQSCLEENVCHAAKHIGAKVRCEDGLARAVDKILSPLPLPEKTSKSFKGVKKNCVATRYFKT